jgi:hypothetical protein
VSRLSFIVALIAAAPAFAETGYFTQMLDLPLPPGFSESQTATGFDGADGRLIMAEAPGARTAERVRAFYTESLPALGWSFSPTGEGELVFLRDRERLTLTTSGDAAHLRLHVQLTVRPASMNAD